MSLKTEVMCCTHLITRINCESSPAFSHSPTAWSN